MLQTEKIINELDQYLQESRFYYADDDKSELLSNEIYDKWKDRFSNAIKQDFFEFLHLKVSLTDDKFELFGDQGASVWWNRITVEDDSVPVKLSFWMKAVINYKKNRLALEENSLRQAEYSGSNINMRNIFRKLKAAHKDGYESTITIRTVLLE